MDAKPIRTEMIQSYIAQLRASLGEMKPVSEAQLRELFGRQDYTSMVKVIRDKMGLDLRVRVGVVNEGGPVGAPACVSAPKPMPRFVTAEFQQTLFTVCLRKTFVSSHNFEEVAIAIAHELSHIVLFGINHSPCHPGWWLKPRYGRDPDLRPLPSAAGRWCLQCRLRHS